MSLSEYVKVSFEIIIVEAEITCKKQSPDVEPDRCRIAAQLSLGKAAQESPQVGVVSGISRFELGPPVQHYC